MSQGWTRARRFALGLALGAVGLVAGASGFVVWRKTHRPTCSLHLGPGVDALRFLLEGRTLAVEASPVGQPSWRQAFSLETGACLGPIDGSFETWSPWTGHVLFTLRGVDELYVECRDPVTAERCGREIVLPGRDKRPAAFGPHDDVVAFLSSSGALEIRSTDGGALRKTIETGPPPEGTISSRLAIAPSGDAVAVFHKSERNSVTSIWSLVTGARRQTRPSLGLEWFLGFTSSGEPVFLTLGDLTRPAELIVLDAVGAPRLRRDAISSAAVSASGTRAATFEPWGADPSSLAVVVVALDTGAVVRTIGPVRGVPADLALAPEGDAVAFGTEDGLIEVWQLPGP